MKKVCVFGADGRTGVHVVEALLKKQYEVIACIYRINDASIFDEKVETRVCDVTNLNQVKSALKGADGVISVIGHVKNSDKMMQTVGTQNILKAMNDFGIKRILSLTGTGVRRPNDIPSLLDKFLNLAISIIDPERIKDGIEHANILRASHIDWTLIRVLKLTNQSFKINTYTLNEHGPAELFTPRAKVATIMVDLLEDSSSFQKLPIVSA